MRDGAAQGDTGSALAFSRAYRAAIAKVKAPLLSDGEWVLLLSLTGDLLGATEPRYADSAMRKVAEELGAIGIRG